MKNSPMIFAVCVVGLVFCSSASASDPNALIDELTRDMARAAGKAEVPPIGQLALNDTRDNQDGNPAVNGADNATSLAASLKAQVAQRMDPSGAKAAPKKLLKETVGTRTSTNSTGYIAVGAALLLLAGIGFWLKRRSQLTSWHTSARIETIATTRIAGKHLVSLIRVPGRILVVGLGDNGLTLLTELDESELSGEAAKAPQPNAGESFLDRLVGMKDDRGSEVLDTDPFVKSRGVVAPADELLNTSNEQQAIRERLNTLRQRASASNLGSVTTVC